MLNIVDIYGEIEGDYDVIVTLPYNPTNGDVIKAMFPDTEEIEERVNEVVVYVLGSYRAVNTSWWNAPYKAESEK